MYFNSFYQIKKCSLGPTSKSWFWHVLDLVFFCARLRCQPGVSLLFFISLIAVDHKQDKNPSQSSVNITFFHFIQIILKYRTKSWYLKNQKKKNLRWLRWFFFLFMVNSYVTNKNLAMRLQVGIVAGRKKIPSPKHAKIMILRSVQVNTLVFLKTSLS